MIFSYFLDSYFLSYGEFGELIMKLSHAALRPLLAAHERGALPLVGAAWGVTVRKSHNASNARGVAAGKMGRKSRNSSEFNYAIHGFENVSIIDLIENDL